MRCSTNSCGRLKSPNRVWPREAGTHSPLPTTPRLTLARDSFDSSCQAAEITAPSRDGRRQSCPGCQPAQARLRLLLSLTRAKGLQKDGAGRRSPCQAGVPLRGGVAVAPLWVCGSPLPGELPRLMLSQGGGLWGAELSCGCCRLSSIPAGLGSIQQHLSMSQGRSVPGSHPTTFPALQEQEKVSSWVWEDLRGRVGCRHHPCPLSATPEGPCPHTAMRHPQAPQARGRAASPVLEAARGDASSEEMGQNDEGRARRCCGDVAIPPPHRAEHPCALGMSSGEVVARRR